MAEEFDPQISQRDADSKTKKTEFEFTLGLLFSNLCVSAKSVDKKSSVFIC
jgi:hypothetical protein